MSFIKALIHRLMYCAAVSSFWVQAMIRERPFPAAHCPCGLSEFLLKERAIKEWETAALRCVKGMTGPGLPGRRVSGTGKRIQPLVFMVPESPRVRWRLQVLVRAAGCGWVQSSRGLVPDGAGYVR